MELIKFMDFIIGPSVNLEIFGANRDQLWVRSLRSQLR